jgi:hypothetical protein
MEEHDKKWQALGVALEEFAEEHETTSMMVAGAAISHALASSSNFTEVHEKIETLRKLLGSFEKQASS